MDLQPICSAPISRRPPEPRPHVCPGALSQKQAKLWKAGLGSGNRLTLSCETRLHCETAAMRGKGYVLKDGIVSNSSCRTSAGGGNRLLNPACKCARRPRTAVAAANG